MRKYIILIHLLFVNVFLFAQRQTDIEIDFLNKKMSAPTIPLNGMGKGDTYRIVVKRINLNLYDVSIGTKDSTPPQEALKFPSFESFSVDNLSKLIAELGKFYTDVGSSTPSIISALNGSSPKNIPSSSTTENDTKFNDFVIKYIGKLSTLKSQIATQKVEIDKEIYELFRDIQLMKVQCPPTTAFTLQDVYNKIDKRREELYKIQRLADSEAIDMRKQDYYKKFLSGDETLAKKGELLERGYALIDSTIFQALKSLSVEKLQPLLNDLIVFNENNDCTYTSLPMTLNEEVAKVTIKISPRNNLSLPSYTTTLAFSSKKDKYIWGISSSTFLSFLHDDAYSTKMSQDSTFTLIQENPGKAEFGANSMFRVGGYFSNSSTPSWNVGIGAGVAITNKIKPRLFLGAGFGFGKKHNLIIDGGINIGYSNRISNVYNTSGVYSSKPENVTISTLRYSGYLGIGYMFLK